MARTISFTSEGTEVALGMNEAGSGRSVVLLPALSSISTCAEMQSLFDRLAPAFRVSTVDWPGFGNHARPRADWSPEILSAFLNWFLSEIVAPPHAVVAAGHAATYALHQAVYQPGKIDRLVLIAPTWRGPLPTMMGGGRPWFARIRAAVDHPVAGPLLYRLNVSRFVLSRMARKHVYSDPDWLTGDRLTEKVAVTRAPGARHASVRFVSGGLDRIGSRAAFLDLARRSDVPILMVYGDQTPPKSRSEMEALAELPNVQVQRLAKGKLAIHEEFPDAVASAIMPFLSHDRQWGFVRD
jgi:pimeloyl-ACP methyl ester carboxylesterase